MDGNITLNIDANTREQDKIIFIPFIQYSSNPRWGRKLQKLRCPTCGSPDMWSSAHSHDPEEIIGYEWVRCRRCGRITDYYESSKSYDYYRQEPLHQVEDEYKEGH